MSGRLYIDKLTLSGSDTSLFGCTGDPNGVVTGVVGDFILSDNGTQYKCTAAPNTWAVAGGSAADIFPQSSYFTAPPVAASGWTLANSASLDNTTAPTTGLFCYGPGSATDIIRRATRSFAGAIALKGRIRWTGPVRQFVGGGLLLRDSATGKQIIYGVFCNVTAVNLGAIYYNSDTSYAGSAFSGPTWVPGLTVWYIILVSGGNLVSYMSTDGEWYYEVATIPVATVFGAGAPDQCGIGFNALSSGGYNAGLTYGVICDSWQTS